MADPASCALLREACDILNARPDHGFWRGASATRRDLAARIHRYLSGLSPNAVDRFAIELARARHAGSTSIRIDPDETIVAYDEVGTWVRAWVHVGDLAANGPLPDVDRSRFEAALATLPDEQRDIYLLCQRERLPIALIAQALNRPVEDVERLFNAALAALLLALAHALD